MITSIFCRLLYIGFGILVPSFTTLRFIERRRLTKSPKCSTIITDDDQVKISHLLSYWTVFGVFSMIQLVTDMFIWWIPFYSKLKLLATCVLATCGTQMHLSANLIFLVVAPVLHYSEPITRKLANMVGVKGFETALSDDDDDEY